MLPCVRSMELQTLRTDPVTWAWRPVQRSSPDKSERPCTCHQKPKLPVSTLTLYLSACWRNRSKFVAGSKAAYSSKVDIYSLGIIFFEMCHPPWPTGMERVKVLSSLRQPDINIPHSEHLTTKEVIPGLCSTHRSRIKFRF
jgi:serine/threonine protein kinase